MQLRQLHHIAVSRHDALETGLARRIRGAFADRKERDTQDRLPARMLRDGVDGIRTCDGEGRVHAVAKIGPGIRLDPQQRNMRDDVPPRAQQSCGLETLPFWAREQDVHCQPVTKKSGPARPFSSCAASAPSFVASPTKP